MPGSVGLPAALDHLQAPPELAHHPVSSPTKDSIRPVGLGGPVLVLVQLWRGRHSVGGREVGV